MSSTFKRQKEDFVCQKCGTSVSGSGFTNHCPECLWSKHVDVHPGDRAAACGGMMEPAQVEVKGREYSIVHICTVCGLQRRNKAAKEDNFHMLVQIAAEHSSRL